VRISKAMHRMIVNRRGGSNDGVRIKSDKRPSSEHISGKRKTWMSVDNHTRSNVYRSTKHLYQ
jgi:hypothetical protein